MKESLGTQLEQDGRPFIGSLSLEKGKAIALFPTSSQVAHLSCVFTEWGLSDIKFYLYLYIYL